MNMCVPQVACAWKSMSMHHVWRYMRTGNSDSCAPENEINKKKAEGFGIG